MKDHTCTGCLNHCKRIKAGIEVHLCTQNSGDNPTDFNDKGLYTVPLGERATNVTHTDTRECNGRV